MQNLEQSLRQFIVDNFLFGCEDEICIGPDTSLLEAGILDSTGALELVHHLEQAYGIIVDDEEFVPDNLDTINRLSAYITRKRCRGGYAA